jgi:hypothetical protein
VNGSTLLTQPRNGFSDSNLAKLFAAKNNESSTRSGKNIGAIVGGTVGGVVIIVLFAVVIWFLWLRRSHNQKETPSSDREQQTAGEEFPDPTLNSGQDKVPGEKDNKGNKGNKDADCIA